MIFLQETVILYRMYMYTESGTEVGIELPPVTGGNSRTTMIATISPADINYEETLSTLR